MNLLQLTYFQTAANFENMTKAAAALFISQPALSKAIAQLEAELDVKLFDRQGRTIQLNKFGYVFLSYLNESLNSLEQGKQAILELKQQETNSISLYMPVGSPALPNLVQIFKQNHPEVRLNLMQHNHDGLLNYDFAITTEPQPNDEKLFLLSEEFYLGVPINHHLSAKKIIQLKELTNEEFIGLTTAKALRRTVDTYFKENEFKGHYIYESDDPATVRGLIEAGLGIGIIPSILWQTLHTDKIRLLHFSETPPHRTIYLCWPKELEMTGINRIIINEIKSFFSGLERTKLSIY
ncbi:LysR family transcriptional regulator [Carnobacterium gallinarum]|uniref:LysR family transcriptional regulator n=1 Tax=Carnobacterium gallinarum TaxID=2749 RepID=UPI00068B83D9|nr:LysR family transcriptional regulator [Carnobacterium gallinarum]